MLSSKQMMVSVLALAVANTWAADHEVSGSQTLQAVTVTGKRPQAFESLPFTQARKASDKIISGETLKQRSATLGNALAGEPGIHSNPFGGGASAPVIRGQEGVRVKILQNGSDVVDMSALSPDHAVATDTLLASQVELVRGAATLLYASASPAGVLNVADKRIPAAMPEKGYEGEFGARYNSNSKEKLATAGITLGVGEHIAIRAEGLSRHADNYRVPGINLGETVKFVPDTHHKSKVGTIGASLIGERGYVGASYSYRKDKYGLTGHNHKFDSCTAHIYGNQFDYSYTYPYPHLMEAHHISENPHFHCGSDHGFDPGHSHEHPYGHNHDHSHPGPWVDLVSKRFDLRSEIKQPLPGIEKIRISLARADYYHDEKDAGKSFDTINPEREQEKARKNYGRAVNIFKNRGFNSRLELYHQPLGGLSGVWGVQYQTQKSSANSPDNREVRWPLAENTNKQFSLFALEQYRWKNFLFEAGARAEKQGVYMDYDAELLKSYRETYADLSASQELPDLAPNKQKAFSYSGALHWDFHPDYRLSLTASHNERLPTPAELYYHGQHLATNSFEYGNKNLKKEQSNNIELGLRHSSESWDYGISAYYSRFKNYIHNENLYRENNLFMRRQTQSQAKIYGIEGQLSYRFTPNHQATLFGDYVRGKLFDLPKLPGKDLYGEAVWDEDYQEDVRPYLGKEMLAQPGRNAPRMPPARLGIRFNSTFNQKWNGSLAYTRIFKQNKTGKLESASKGYHLLDMGLNYRNKLGKSGYQLSLNANNLLNQKVYIHNSFLPYVPQIGRNFSFGINVDF